jgi:hypothetical protein
VRADLEEEFREVAETRGVAAARRWYVWEAVKLTVHVRWERIRVREGTDGTKGGGLMDRAGRNIRIAFRRFRRAPGFTAVAVITIALGIGANVAIFTVVDTVLLEPLPYDRPDELVVLWEWHQPRDRRENVANPGNFKAWRERSSSFSTMTAVSLAVPSTIAVDGEPDEVRMQSAASDFFDRRGRP